MALKAAILLSRQALRPHGQTAWVRQAAKAVEKLKHLKATLLSSAGLQTWDLITSLGSMYRLPMHLYFPATDDNDALLEAAVAQFELDPGLKTFCTVDDTGNLSPMQIMGQRDRRIIAEADLLLPVSLRPGGNLETLMNNSEATIDNSFRTDYEIRQEPISYQVDPNRLHSGLSSVSGRYIVHWTRGTSEAWPDERRIDLYRELLNSRRWPRNGLDTLKHILRNGQLISSGRHMPGNCATVSFSGLSPADVIPLMRWRARYREMSLEPYGIGIERATALNHGIKPVYYYQHRPESSLPRWQQQSVGRLTDWRAEKEFRHIGDFDLKKIPRETLVVFCRYELEAKELCDEFGLRTVPIEKDSPAQAAVI